MARIEVPSWESELWSYVSSGDGMHCPLRESCAVRRSGSWCADDNTERISGLLDDRQFDFNKYDDFPKYMGTWIFRLVERLATEYIEKARVQRPPVPIRIVRLADEQHEVNVHLLPLKTCHGAIWPWRRRWLIQLNENDSSAIKRFTLFHEVFHILAHIRCVPVFKKMGYMQGAFNEILADYFSRCILMPRKWAEGKWAEAEDLDRMVEIFDAPKPVVWRRLREIGAV